MALDELLKHPSERNAIQDKMPQEIQPDTATAQAVETISPVTTNIPLSKTAVGQSPPPEDKTPIAETETPPQDTATASFKWQYRAIVLAILAVIAGIIALKKIHAPKKST
jgi:hypothetical protein